jgi:hemerythrin
MAFIDWETRYSVGVKQIDTEHQRLIGIINELHEAMTKGKGKDILERILGDLLEYTETHFTNEEALMQKAGYPGFEAHHVLHTDLVRQVKELQAKAKAGSALVSISVLNFLREWLTSHILNTDKQYQSHLNSKGIF